MPKLGELRSRQARAAARRLRKQLLQLVAPPSLGVCLLTPTDLRRPGRQVSRSGETRARWTHVYARLFLLLVRDLAP
eukprot:6602426-Heterocapsa_arctica.AAC.1